MIKLIVLVCIVALSPMLGVRANDEVQTATSLIPLEHYLLSTKSFDQGAKGVQQSYNFIPGYILKYLIINTYGVNGFCGTLSIMTEKWTIYNSKVYDTVFSSRLEKKLNGYELLKVDIRDGLRINERHFLISIDQIPRGTFISSMEYRETNGKATKEIISKPINNHRIYNDEKKLDIEKSGHLAILPYIEINEGKKSSTLIERFIFTIDSAKEETRMRSLSLSDINNDNLVDIMYGGRAFINKGGMSFVDESIQRGLKKIADYAITIDINNDGLIDCITINMDSSKNLPKVSRFNVYRNKGTGYFVNSQSFTLSNKSIQPICFSVFDLNNDGSRDIVLCCAVEKDQYLVKIINNKGHFDSPSLEKLESDVWFSSMTVYDLNKDGFSDILYGNANTHSLSYLENDGKGNFYKGKVTGVDILNQNEMNKVGLSRGLCLFGIDEQKQSLQVVMPLIYRGENKNSSDKEFTNHLQEISFRGCSVGDLDNDGYNDVVFTSLTMEPLVFTYNKQEHCFENQFDFETEKRQSYAFESAICDFDQDGIQDIILMQTNGFGVYKNNGKTASGSYNVIEVDTKDVEEIRGGVLYLHYLGGITKRCLLPNSRGIMVQDYEKLHIGSDSRSRLDSISVEWRDGKKESFHVNNNKKYLLIEKNRGIDITPKVVNLTLSPNPVIGNKDVTMTISNAKGYNLTIRIFDDQGSIVKEFDKTMIRSDRELILWNAKNSEEMAVSSGNYTIDIKGDNVSLIQRISIVK